MTLDAIDAVRRGLANLRANWQLVLLQWAAGVAMMALAVASLLPPLLALGLTGLLALFVSGQSRQVPETLGRAIGDPAVLLSAPFLAAGCVSVVLMTILGWLWCWFQAGTLGVLVTGDRRAPAGAAADWRRFAVFSGREFLSWAQRRAWRFFWYVNLGLAVVLLLLGLLAGLAVVAVAIGQSAGLAAGLGLGCLGALPLFLLLLVCGIGFALGQVDLVREGSGVFRAVGVGFAVLRRRLGGVLLLYVLMIAASVALAMVEMVIDLPLGVLLGDHPAPFFFIRLPWMLVEWGASAALAVAFAASLVALVVAETPDERAA